MRAERTAEKRPLAPVTAGKAVRCPQCGHLAEDVRCPRCNTLLIASCTGACSSCRSRCR